jgi:hypothetical protein
MARPRAINERLAQGPCRCRFCPAVLHDKKAPEAQGWDWVTGNLLTTEHCCPTCQKTNGAMWAEIVRRAASHNTQGEKNG